MSDPYEVSALTIGRAGFDVPLCQVSAWDTSGDQVQISGRIGYTRLDHAVADAKVGRQQLLGLVNNPDESVVPVLYAPDSTLDGYYRVTAMQVRLDGTSEASYDSGVWPFDATLEPVRGLSTAVTECTCYGVVRRNDLGITHAIAWHSFPGNTQELWADNGDLNLFHRQAEDGDVALSITGVTASDMVYRPRGWIAPADFYQAAAQLQQTDILDADTTLRRVVIGRNTFLDPDGWRLCNGFIDVRPDSHAGQVRISWFNGTTWTAPKRWSFHGETAGGAVADFSTVTPLWVGPDRAAIRLGTSISFGRQWGRVWIDIGVSRGDRWARCVLSSDRVDNWGVWSETGTTASTAITGGIRATANDSEGNRFILASGRSRTGGLSTGRLTSAASLKGIDFGIGIELGGSGASTFPETADHQVSQYMWAQHERTAVVAR